MIFNKDILFIHVPKTGGTSAEEWLANVLTPPVYWTDRYFNQPPVARKSEPVPPGVTVLPMMRHEPLPVALAAMFEQGLDPAQLKAIVAVRRNPYALEVSKYHYFLDYEAKYPRAGLIDIQSGFGWFLYNHVGFWRGKYTPQEYYQPPPELADKFLLLDCDQLDAQLPALAGLLGVDAPPPVPRKNTTKHGRWQDYYNVKLSDIVYEAYKWIFERGWYERFIPEHDF